MKMTVGLRNLDGVEQLLRKLPKEVVSNQRGGMVAASMRKGANVVKDAIKTRLERSIDQDETTGTLIASLRVKRGKAVFGSNGERFVVNFKRKSYPKKPGQKKAATTLQVIQLKEYGSSRQLPDPTIRPGFEASAGTAIVTISDDLVKRVDKAAQKYLKKA